MVREYRAGDRVLLKPSVIAEWCSSHSYSDVLTLHEHPYTPAYFRVYRNDVDQNYTGCASVAPEDILCLANPIQLGGE